MSHEEQLPDKFSGWHCAGTGIMGVAVAYNRYRLICPDGANGSSGGPYPAVRNTGTLECTGCYQPGWVLALRDPDDETRMLADGRVYQTEIDGVLVEVSAIDERGKLDINATK